MWVSMMLLASQWQRGCRQCRHDLPLTAVAVTADNLL